MATVETPVAPGVPPHVPAHLVVDIDLYNLEGATEDFHAAWKRVQERSPDMVWTTANGGHWIALRGKLIHEIFADYEHFSSRTIIVPRERGDQIKVLPTTLDPPAHRPYRALLNSWLSPAAVRRLEPDIRRLIVDTIEGLRGKGRCDFITEFAEVLPIRIFMRMVKLPLEDAPKLKGWTDALLRPDAPNSAEEIMGFFADYLRPYLDERRRNPGDDVISYLVTTPVNGQPLTEAQSIEITSQIMMGGLDTVISSLGFMMAFLAKSPAHRRQLNEQPELMPGAVEELLRRFPIVQNGRMVRDDYDFHGFQLRAGDMVVMPGVLHGLDEREHPDPLKVDFQRSSAGHSTFGNGAHRCPGSTLARTEISMAIGEWLRRIPEFELDPDDRIRMHGGCVGTVNRLPLRWDPATTRGFDD